MVQLILLLVGHTLQRAGPAAPTQPVMKGKQMNTATENLILRQRQRMYELRDDTRDIASNVAEQVFDQFEREVYDITSDGFKWENADATLVRLQSAISKAFDDACEKHVLSIYERLSDELAAAAGQRVFDDGRFGLDTLRKSLRIRSLVKEPLQQGINRAQQSFGRIFSIAFKVPNPLSGGLDDTDEQMYADADRLRAGIMESSEQLRNIWRDTALDILHRGRLAYTEQLETLPARLAAQSTTHGEPLTADAQ